MPGELGFAAQTRLKLMAKCWSWMHCVKARCCRKHPTSLFCAFRTTKNSQPRNFCWLPVSQCVLGGTFYMLLHLLSIGPRTDFPQFRSQINWCWDGRKNDFPNLSDWSLGILDLFGHSGQDCCMTSGLSTGLSGSKMAQILVNIRPSLRMQWTLQPCPCIQEKLPRS